MSIPVLLLIGGYALVYTGWKGLSLVDFATNLAGSQKIKTPAERGGIRSDTSPSRTAGAIQSATHGHASGVAQYEGKPVAAWIVPILKYAKAHGWNGTVTSGYRSHAEQTAIYNSGVRPAARPGTSNHEGTVYPRGAVDVTNPQQLSQVLMRSPYRSTLVWAGSKDPVHFSHPHGGSY